MVTGCGTGHGLGANGKVPVGMDARLTLKIYRRRIFGICIGKLGKSRHSRGGGEVVCPALLHAVFTLGNFNFSIRGVEAQKLKEDKNL